MQNTDDLAHELGSEAAALMDDPFNLMTLLKMRNAGMRTADPTKMNTDYDLRSVDVALRCLEAPETLRTLLHNHLHQLCALLEQEGISPAPWFTSQVQPKQPARCHECPSGFFRLLNATHIEGLRP